MATWFRMGIAGIYPDSGRDLAIPRSGAGPRDGPAVSIPRLAVRAAVANLRREPSHAAELVSQLVLGEEAEALERVEGWVRVAGPDGYAGWVDAPAVAADLSGPAGALVWVRRSGLLYADPEAGAAPL